MKRATVSVDYSYMAARLLIGNEEENFEIDGMKFYNKTDGKQIKELVGGDRLEIYYTDENYEKIDHILVEKAEVLELYSAFTPGGPFDTKDIYSTDTSVVVNNSRYGVFRVIDRSGNFIDLVEIDDSTPLYGTYIEEETKMTGYKAKLHYLYALYLYNPQG